MLVDCWGHFLTSLPSRIISQDEALSSILDSFSAWEFEKQSGFAQPLVLAFTGPTGKLVFLFSRTAFAIFDRYVRDMSRCGQNRNCISDGKLFICQKDQNSRYQEVRSIFRICISDLELNRLLKP